MMQLLIKNGNCVNANGRFRSDIAIADGKITQIGQELQSPSERTIDAQGKLILPDVIDAHVHPIAGNLTLISFGVLTQGDRLLPALWAAMTPGSGKRLSIVSRPGSMPMS